MVEKIFFLFSLFWGFFFVMSNDLTMQRSPGRRSHDCVPGVAAQLLVFNTTSREGRFFYFFLLCLVIFLFFWHWPLRADASVWNEVARSCQKDGRYLVDQCRLRGTGVALYQTHTEDRLNINRPPTAGTHVHSHRDSLPCVCVCVLHLVPSYRHTARPVFWGSWPELL